MITWHDVIQGTEEWLALRRGLWTGSIALRLLQGKSLPMEYEFAGNDATRRGHMLEVIAIREYERKYRTKVARPGFVTNSVYTNAGYSPDGIDGGWLIEAKALNGMKHDKLFETGRSLPDLQSIFESKIPIQYKVQIFFGMIITGKRKARLLAVNPENEEQLVVIEIGYDRLIGDNIRSKLRLDMKQRARNLTHTPVTAIM
jgi:hypothetical protein